MREIKTGAIIAGGRARRMGGAAKGLMKVGGVPVVARLAEVLRAVCDKVVVIGDPEGPYAKYGDETWPDLMPDKGAPGGVYTALANAEAGWVFAAACDLPFLDQATIEALYPHGEGRQAALYKAGGRLQPLAGWWHTSAKEVFEAALPSNPGFRRITAGLDVAVVQASEARAFENVNTPEELERVGAVLDG